MFSRRDSRVPALAAALTGALLAVVPTPASAAVIHVYEGQSIQEAIDSASGGDEIIVHPGTYNEAIDLLGKLIWLHSSDGAEVTAIDGTGLNTTVVTCANGEGPDTILEGFTVTGGDAAGLASGGGMWNHDSSPTIVSCIFTNNDAVEGGGVANSSSSSLILDCAFNDNSAIYAGGGMVNYSSDIMLINCIFAGNSCDFEYGSKGGGMSSYDSHPTVVNCMFHGNSAQGYGFSEGGGLYNHAYSSATLAHCTFSANFAYVGGGIFTSNYSSISPTVANCIVRGNPGGEIVGPAEVTYSNVQGGVLGEGNIDADPLFVDPANGDFRLSPSSPCIDAADNTAVPTGILTDLDGLPRFVDDPATPDTGNGTPPIVDMGAYEFQVVSPCPADVNGDNRWMCSISWRFSPPGARPPARRTSTAMGSST